MITVFTPTYNREKLIKRVYESLLAQSDHDFEWIVIDDGSIDNTERIVKSFDNTVFPIIYVKQTNGGKHTAYNQALKLSKGEFFFCVDADDWLVENAISDIKEYLSSILCNVIIAYKENEKKLLLSDRFPEGIQEVNWFDLKNIYRCKGEFTLIFSTNFAKKYPFPVFNGEKFVTEAVIYDKMACDTNVVLLPKTLMICEYQQDGLTQNLYKTMLANPKGYQLYHAQRVDLVNSMNKRFAHAIRYQAFRQMTPDKKNIYQGKYKGVVRLALFPGMIAKAYYQYRNRR
ncbi:MAG: glycosyltransferase family A protein [Lachnospiraceae bacterium]|nr:glycosyltransferase family A protein [Lachnospiraceae bacterium]